MKHIEVTKASVETNFGLGRPEATAACSIDSMTVAISESGAFRRIRADNSFPSAAKGVARGGGQKCETWNP
jgi:hypothetical protein